MVLFGNYTLSSVSDNSIVRNHMKYMCLVHPYYQKLNDSQRVQLMAIIQNMNLTQEQLVNELIAWGSKQSPEIQVNFAKFDFLWA